MRAEQTTASASKPRKKAKPQRQVATREFGVVARPIKLFCQAVLDTGDVTRAYMESHPDCKTERQAKYRGRALLKRGDVRAYIAELKAKVVAGQGVEINPRKAALLEELNLVAFAGINLKKLHPKEKLTALRTIAEIEGWMKPKEQGTGLRATFNFVVGGSRRGATGRTVTVDVDTGAGVDGVASASERTSSVLDAVQPDNKLVGVGLPSESESESESESAVPVYGNTPLSVDDTPLSSRNSPQSRSQVADLTESGAETGEKAPNTSAPSASRSTPTGRSGASRTRQPVDKSSSRLFDASNT